VLRLVLVDVGRQHVYDAAAHAAATDRAAGARAAIGRGRRVVRACPHAGRLPHAGQPVERRRLHALDQTVERLYGLEFGHHFVQQPVRPGPG